MSTDREFAAMRDGGNNFRTRDRDQYNHNKIVNSHKITQVGESEHINASSKISVQDKATIDDSLHPNVIKKDKDLTLNLSAIGNTETLMAILGLGILLTIVYYGSSK